MRRYGWNETPWTLKSCREISESYDSGMNDPSHRSKCPRCGICFFRPTAGRHLAQAAPERRNPKPLAGELAAIRRKTRGRQDAPCHVKTQPGPPGADVRTRATHPAGEMLEMAHRISQITGISGSRPDKHPNQRLIGSRKRSEHRISARQIRHPCLVELEDGLRRLPGHPLRLGVTQRVLIELRAPLAAMPAGDREIMNLTHFGKPWTRWIHGRHFPFCRRGTPEKFMRTF